jgi:hypothetical protein
VIRDAGVDSHGSSPSTRPCGGSANIMGKSTPAWQSPFRVIFPTSISTPYRLSLLEIRRFLPAASSFSILYRSE